MYSVINPNRSLTSSSFSVGLANRLFYCTLYHVLNNWTNITANANYQYLVNCSHCELYPGAVALFIAHMIKQNHICVCSNNCCLEVYCRLLDYWNFMCWLYFKKLYIFILKYTFWSEPLSVLLCFCAPHRTFSTYYWPILKCSVFLYTNVI